MDWTTPLMILDVIGSLFLQLLFLFALIRFFTVLREVQEASVGGHPMPWYSNAAMWQGVHSLLFILSGGSLLIARHVSDSFGRCCLPLVWGAGMRISHRSRPVATEYIYRG